MQILLSFCLTVIHLALAAPQTTEQGPQLPPPETRGRMFRELAAEMERLDGEALHVRGNRVRPFTRLVSELAQEAERAQDWSSFLRAFSRLDQAFPNLHSSFQVEDWIEPSPRGRAKVGISGEWLAPGSTALRVSRVDADLKGEALPQPGDRVLAVDGRSVADLTAEHFEFCKFPLRDQCEMDFSGSFLRAQTAGGSFTLTLVREGSVWDFAVPVEGGQPPPRRNKPSPCADEPVYPGYTLAHAGRFACVHLNDQDPSKALLRITSFMYSRMEPHAIDSIYAEVNALWPWWKKHAAQIQHLGIDVVDNGGGNLPVPYYQILFPKPFQEQWVSFRKVPELEDPVLRKSFFWNSNAQEIWFENIRREGVWDSVAWGAYLPPVPMFCVDEEHDCREGLFRPRQHEFRGRVSLVLNQWCVSSCDGFAYSLKEELGDRLRLVGQPQAADSAYSRVAIHTVHEKGSFRLALGPIYSEKPAGTLFTQTVPITRSVTAAGVSVGGKPVPIDLFVPRTYEQDDQDWRLAAVRKAME